MPNALRRCTLHQFSKGNNQLYLYMLYKYKQLLSTFIAHSTGIGLQRNVQFIVNFTLDCWKWSSSPSASVQNRVQISVHSPVHESSPESTVQVLHQPVQPRVNSSPSFIYSWYNELSQRNAIFAYLRFRVLNSKTSLLFAGQNDLFYDRYRFQYG